jgi:ABC-type Co2+ transport system permease subunit
MEALFGIMTAFGLSASAGLNAYIPLLIAGVVAHYTDWITLNPPYDLLANAWVLIVIGLLLIVEMLADKFPAVNHLNDIIQTVIRPVAGAIVFAASAHVITNVHPVIAIICGLLVAGSVHTVKAAAVRPAVTAATGGAANIPVSIAEDVVASILSILSIVLPVLVAVFLIVFTVLIIWWLRRRAIRKKQQTAS